MARLMWLWLVLGQALFPTLARARDTNLYVSPQGTLDGLGTRSEPYDLATALSDSIGRPGDTFWLGGGIYQIGHIDTQVHGRAGQPLTFRAMRGERAQIIGSLTMWGEAGHVVFRDLEVSSGVAKRVSSQRNAGFNPTDLTNFLEGIQVYSPNCSFINLVVHDSVGSAFYTSVDATNTLIYGCIVYNAGWASTDDAEGHSFYLQGSGEIADNLAFNSAGAGFHVYANGKDARLCNLTLDGNVAFGAGTLQTVRPYRDWIVGVDAPAQIADNITLRNNMGYAVPGPTTLSEVQLGREQVNGALTASSNYWPQGMALGKWREASVSGNVLAPEQSKRAVVFVRPNRYEPGRLNIVVYNWERSAKVAVDVCSCLPLGLSYEVRNAEDLSAPAMVRGQFDGKPLELPMTGLTVARPMGGLRTPAPTGPMFNVFVLMPVEQPDKSPRSIRAGTERAVSPSGAGKSEVPNPKSETNSIEWKSQNGETGTRSLAAAASVVTRGPGNFGPSQK